MSSINDNNVVAIPVTETMIGKFRVKNYTVSGIREKLITLLLYSVLFPFVMFPPLRTDLQPLAGLLAFLIMVRFTKMRFTRVQLYVGFLLILISALSIVFILIGLVTIQPGNYQIFQFSKVFSLFYGLIILYVFESNDIYFRKKILNNAVLIYAVCTLLYLVFRGGYLALQSLVVNNRYDGSDPTAGIRGVAILSPEPSVFSSILIFMLRLNDNMYYDRGENTRKRFRLNFLLITMMIVFNKSATGLFLFMIYLLFFFFMHIKYTLIYIASFLVLSVAVILNIDLSNSNNRSLLLLLQIIDSRHISIWDILLKDSSFNRRFEDWLLGFYSLFTFPLGVGYPFFYDAISHIIDKYGMTQYYRVSPGVGLVSPMGYALVTFGGFFFILMIILLFKKKSYWFDKVYFFYNVSFSISFGFPLSWAILTLNKKNTNK